VEIWSKLVDKNLSEKFFWGAEIEFHWIDPCLWRLRQKTKIWRQFLRRPDRSWSILVGSFPLSHFPWLLIFIIFLIRFPSNSLIIIRHSKTQAPAQIHYSNAFKVTGGSIAMYVQTPKPWLSVGIRTHDRLFWRRRFWPLYRASVVASSSRRLALYQGMHRGLFSQKDLNSEFSALCFGVKSQAV
jgi:hypothetical protein